MYEISAPIQIQKDEAQEMLTALVRNQRAIGKRNRFVCFIYNHMVRNLRILQHDIQIFLTDNMTWYQNPKMPENLKTGIYSEDELGYSFMENPDNAPAIDYDADAETIGITDRSILPDWAKVVVDSQDECITVFNKKSGFKAMMPDKMNCIILGIHKNCIHVNIFDIKRINLSTINEYHTCLFRQCIQLHNTYMV